METTSLCGHTLLSLWPLQPRAEQISTAEPGPLMALLRGCIPEASFSPWKEPWASNPPFGPTWGVISWRDAPARDELDRA